MTKDTPDDDQTDQKKKEEDKIKQDKSRAEIIKALVAKGANIKIAGKLHLGNSQCTTLLTIWRIVLNEKFQGNASKISIHLT